MSRVAPRGLANADLAVFLVEGLLMGAVVRFDHRDLNADTVYFEKTPPTPENFARVIREILIDAMPAGVALDRIRLQSDADTWVDVIEPAGAP